MRFRLGLLTLCCAFALQAQMQMNASQLADFLRSELALKYHSDKQVAAYLKKVTLTEKLTNKEIQDLEAQGAGPKTSEALRLLQEQSAHLKPPSTSPTYSPGTTPDNSASAAGQGSVRIGPKKEFPPPSSVRQQEILDSVKQYALNYTQNLPNFICTQVTRRYVDFDHSNSYHIIDTAFTHLGYNDGHEDYRTYSVNGQLVDYGMEQLGKRGGLVSSGEFGSLMREIFEPQSQAEFGWDHWGTIRGKLMAVYNYFIDSGHSQYSISYENTQRIITAYKGLVYADQNTGVISRITFQAVDIPSSFPVKSAYEILDYDDMNINGQPYICPLAAKVWLVGGGQKTKNEIEFRNYRKYGTESNITYDTPDALPADKTQEQPAAAARNANGEKQVKPGPKPQTSPKKQTDNPEPTKPTSPWSLPTPPPPPPQ